VQTTGAAELAHGCRSPAATISQSVELPLEFGFPEGVGVGLVEGHVVGGGVEPEADGEVGVVGVGVGERGYFVEPAGGEVEGVTLEREKEQTKASAIEGNTGDAPCYAASPPPPAAPPPLSRMLRAASTPPFALSSARPASSVPNPIAASDAMSFARASAARSYAAASVC